MRNRARALTILLAAALIFARPQESIQQMAARAEAARLEAQPALYTDLAKRQLDAADRLYAAGKSEEARADINDVVTFSDKARYAAEKTGKKLKNTEIAVRKMAEKLRDIKRSLAYEDQPPVAAAIDRLEQMRTDLLSRMFGKAGKNE
jgi:hypothetical protein